MESQNTNQDLKLDVILCGPLKKTEKALLLASDLRIRNDLTGWTRDICAGWGLFSEVTAPEDVEPYLRGTPARTA